jgi:hypothetical protein
MIHAPRASPNYCVDRCQPGRDFGRALCFFSNEGHAAILWQGLAGMRITRRRNAIALLSITLGACLVALAITLNVGWIIINWRSLILLVIGIPLLPAADRRAGLNTIFLVREVKRTSATTAFSMPSPMN